MTPGSGFPEPREVMARRVPEKILVLSHEFPPFGGGGGRILSMLCEELYSRGIACTVVTAAPPRSIRNNFSFPVVYFPTFRRARFKTSVPAMVLFIVQAILFGLCGKAKGHDLLFSNMSIPAGIAGIVLRRVLGLPHMIWYHNTEVTQNRAQGAGFLFREACLFVARRASVNLFISRGLLDLALRYGTIPGPGILPNAVSPVVEDPRPFAEGNKMFLFAARMERVKNPLVLVESVRLLAQKGRLEELSFKLVGSGRQSCQVRKAICRSGLGQQVTLEPTVPHGRMANLYRSAYALVIPSVVEGYPTTVLEAGAFGVPAIGSDTIGNRDAIVHGETGLLCKLDDPGDLASAIVRLCADVALRNRLGQGARARSAAATIEKTAAAFLEGTAAAIG
jgi:glycosyltransferase involved in cell wall biosynthesis